LIERLPEDTAKFILEILSLSKSQTQKSPETLRVPISCSFLNRT